MANVVEIGQVVLETKIKMRKAYDNDDNGQLTNFDQSCDLKKITRRLTATSILKQL